MDFVSDITDSITGKAGQRAAKDAGKVIAASAEEGANLTSRMYDDYEARYSPYAATGAGGIAGMQQVAGDPFSNNAMAGLYGIANQRYDQTPGFQDASAAMTRGVTANAAARGKLGSGNTLQDLFANNAVLGDELKNSQFTRGLNFANFGEQANINRFNRYGSLADMGFNALTNQANLGSTAVSNINNLRTGGASAQAAGMIGAQNARDQGVGNLISLASMAGGYFGGGSNPLTNQAAAGTLQPITSTGVRRPMV